MSITEKDIMVGDWVQYGENPTVKTRVLAISSVDNGKHWHIIAEPETANSMRIVAMHAVEPIPLAADILERNGWSYNNEDAKYAAETWVGNGLMLQENGVGYRIVVVSDYDDEDTNDTQFVITYIHQLQHALRLAGIDKEITV